MNAQVEQLIKDLNASLGTVHNGAKYRLFLRMLHNTSITPHYNDPELIAAQTAQGFGALPEDVSDEQLDRLAETSLKICNEMFDQLHSDIPDLAIVNKVFKTIVG